MNLRQQRTVRGMTTPEHFKVQSPLTGVHISEGHAPTCESKRGVTTIKMERQQHLRPTLHDEQEAERFEHARCDVESG